LPISGRKENPRVRQLIEWTVQSFDAANIRGSATSFVHPRDLQKAYKDAKPLVEILFAWVFRKYRARKIVGFFSRSNERVQSR